MSAISKPPLTADIWMRWYSSVWAPEPEVAELSFDHIIAAGKDLWRHC
jgi:hypothetical protein